MPIVEAKVEVAAAQGDVFELAQDYDLRLRWDPGVGSALALRAQAEETSRAELPRSFARYFPDFQAAVGHIVPQNAALRRLPTIGRWSESRIVVDAPLEDARACRLLGPIELGPPLAELVQGAEPLLFSLARVRFAVVGETLWRGPDGRE